MCIQKYLTSKGIICQSWNQWTQIEIVEVGGKSTHLGLEYEEAVINIDANKLYFCSLNEI